MTTPTDWIDAAAEEFYKANVLRTTCAFKAGANAAIEKLQEMGVGEFDAYTDLQDYWFTLDHRKIMNLEAHEIAKHFANWQHTQTASILAARDERIKELETEVVTKRIDYDALNNSNRKLAEANARIVEFEDIKKGHLKVQEKQQARIAELEALLRRLFNLHGYDEIEQYFSEQQIAEEKGRE